MALDIRVRHQRLQVIPAIGEYHPVNEAPRHKRAGYSRNHNKRILLEQFPIVVYNFYHYEIVLS